MPHESNGGAGGTGRLVGVDALRCSIRRIEHHMAETSRKRATSKRSRAASKRDLLSRPVRSRANIAGTDARADLPADLLLVVTSRTE